jgi:hypothetical protein
LICSELLHLRKQKTSRYRIDFDEESDLTLLTNQLLAQATRTCLRSPGYFLSDTSPTSPSPLPRPRTSVVVHTTFAPAPLSASCRPRSIPETLQATTNYYISINPNFEVFQKLALWDGCNEADTYFARLPDLSRFVPVDLAINSSCGGTGHICATLPRPLKFFHSDIKR